MTDDDSVSLEDAFEFASSTAEGEVESFKGDVPDHSAGLVAARSTDLIETLKNADMARASERAEDPTEEQIREAVVEDIIDILLAIGTVKYEYDLDIASAFKERQSLIEDYKKFEEAVGNAESQSEVIDAMDEHMSEELSEMLDGQMEALNNSRSLEPGDNVDADDYDHDETDKSFQ